MYILEICIHLFGKLLGNGLKFIIPSLLICEMFHKIEVIYLTGSIECENWWVFYESEYVETP